MKTNNFNKIYYMGLSIILVPIIFVGSILLLIFVSGNSDKESEIKPKKEIVVKTKTVIVKDTVFIKKQVLTPKISLQPKINDTVKKIDTFNSQIQ